MSQRNRTPQPQEQLVPGFHGIREALRQGTPRIRELWVSRGKRPGRIAEILRLAEDQGVPVHVKTADMLDALLPHAAHQGLLGLAEPFRYTPLEQMAAAGLATPERGLLLVADHLTDEGNLGALIRTGAFFNAHGLVIPKDRAARVGPGVLKRSAGACVRLPVARVVNMVRCLELLDEMGFWIVGASGDGDESVHACDWCRHVALVVGNEQAGLGRMVRRKCHQLVRIPGAGAIESLNVAVAAGVFLAEIQRQRNP